MPYRKLFLSRWSALIWAVGVLWTAMDVADAFSSSEPSNSAEVAVNTSTGDPAMDNNIALLGQAMSDD